MKMRLHFPRSITATTMMQPLHQRSVSDTPMSNAEPYPWLLLIPQLAAKSAYLRVKVWLTTGWF